MQCKIKNSWTLHLKINETHNKKAIIKTILIEWK